MQRREGHLMKQRIAAILSATTASVLFAAAVHAQVVDNSSAPTVAFEVDPNVLKLPKGMNFGETLGVAVDSKGRIPPYRLTSPPAPTAGTRVGWLLSSGDGTLVQGEGAHEKLRPMA